MYLFTDSDQATQRLKYLAEVYEKTTREFVVDVIRSHPQLVLDLGCGPGFTTHLLAELTRCDRAVGIDNSEHFIKLAEQTRTGRVDFCLHDVTSVPFPMTPCDVLFCRYLLTHLKNPLDLIEKWSTQLGPTGLLVIEEVDWIHSENEIFISYLNIVEAMLADQSSSLYVGPVINSMEDTDLLKRQSSRVGRLAVSNRQAANLFHLNIQSWKHQPFIRTHYRKEMIEGLERDLKILAEDSGQVSEIEWGLRQLVFERK